MDSLSVAEQNSDRLSVNTLVVGDMPYSHLSAMPEADYARLRPQQKREDCFYFTY